jgi:hypothetical protein
MSFLTTSVQNEPSTDIPVPVKNGCNVRSAAIGPTKMLHNVLNGSFGGAATQRLDIWSTAGGSGPITHAATASHPGLCKCRNLLRFVCRALYFQIATPSALRTCFALCRAPLFTWRCQAPFDGAQRNPADLSAVLMAAGGLPSNRNCSRFSSTFSTRLQTP